MTGTRRMTIVTGSARGIGAATALHLAATGYDLVLNALTRRDEVEGVADSARARGAAVAVVLGDVADESVADELFTAAAVLGTVTGLVTPRPGTPAVGPPPASTHTSATSPTPRSTSSGGWSR